MIEFATEKDRDDVLALYRAQIGREFCPWDYDLSRNALNVKAIKCYEKLGFDVVGECHMFEQDFLCYEKALI